MSAKIKILKPYDDNELRWYCIKTRSKVEGVTARGLRNDAGLEVFAPTLRFQRSRRGASIWATEAMFPSYLFARFRYIDSFRHVQSIRGVSRIVGFGGYPSVLPDVVIEDLRQHVSSDEVITIQSSFSVGDEVDVLDGAFAGLRAVVTRVLPAKDRVTILLEFLGADREVHVSTTSLSREIDHPLALAAGGQPG